MGHARPRPTHLASKLLQIRQSLGISQAEMLKRLGLGRPYHYTFISKYELDKNEPPLMVLLAYSKVSGISVETLIDDNVEVDALAFWLQA